MGIALRGGGPPRHRGTEVGPLVAVLFHVGFGLAAHRGRPGGVRDYGTTTTYPWELPFGSRSTECTRCTARGTHLGTPRSSHSGDRSESARAMENNGEGTEGERVEETVVGNTGEGDDLTNGNQHDLLLGAIYCLWYLL